MYLQSIREARQQTVATSQYDVRIHVGLHLYNNKTSQNKVSEMPGNKQLPPVSMMLEYMGCISTTNNTK